MNTIRTLSFAAVATIASFFMSATVSADELPEPTIEQATPAEPESTTQDTTEQTTDTEINPTWNGDVEVHNTCYDWYVTTTNVDPLETVVITHTPAASGSWSEGNTTVEGNTEFTWSDSENADLDNPWTATQPEGCPAPVSVPEPQRIDNCGSDNDGVYLPPASSAYSYYKLVDGFWGGDLQEGFNLWTGKIIATPNEGSYFPGGTVSVWSFEYPNSGPCVPITTDVTYECVNRAVEPWNRTGRFTATINTGSYSIIGWMVEIGWNQWSGSAMGTDSIILPAIPAPAPGLYSWYAGIALAPMKGTDTEPVSIEVNDDCSPTTEPTIPDTEPEIKTLETVGECQTFTVTNTGNVVTGNTQFGVMLNRGNLPPGAVIVEPGQSVSYDVAVGETVSLGFSEEGSFTVNGPSEYTGINCRVEGEEPTISNPPTAHGDRNFIPIPDTTQRLPETGSGPLIVVFIAAIFLTVGALLKHLAKVRKSSSWT